MRITCENDVVATEVRALMARHRDTQATLGQALGIRQQVLSRRLTGKVAFDQDLIERIATRYEVPLTALLGVADKKCDVA